MEGEGGNPWMTDPFNAHYLAAHKATEIVYNIEPDYTRGGGSIPVTLTLQVHSHQLYSHNQHKQSAMVMHHTGHFMNI